MRVDETALVAAFSTSEQALIDVTRGISGFPVMEVWTRTLDRVTLLL